MAVKPETIDRLLLSRSLIAPLRFRPANDRFAVAAYVLAAHDAAELAIAAICTEKSVPHISDTRALGLPDYLGALKQHLHPGRDVRARGYISKLNRVRVDLKHHSITPDKEQWGNVAETVFEHISAWCTEYLKVDYGELDAADLIHSQMVRDKLLLARKCLREGQFKDCLETLAQVIDQSSLEVLPIGIHVPAGYADAETALTLSAYGIDPGRYLALQRLLPKCATFFGAGPCRWEKREYGHEANWKQPNAEFAYAETVNLLTRLQGATPYPTPYRYEDVFKDVLIIKKDAPNVTVLRWSWPDGWVVSDEQPRFTVGDRIECRAFGSFMDVPKIPDPEQCTRDPEDSLQVVAKDVQHCDKLKDEGMPPSIVFAREDVEITAEPWYEEDYKE